MAAAAFSGRVILSNLLAELVHPCPPGPQRQLYRCQTNAEGRAVLCRDRYSLWRVYLQSFVTIIPKIEFSLCAVSPVRNEDRNMRSSMSECADALGVQTSSVLRSERLRNHAQTFLA
jgi:hypothetical protein